LSLRFSFAPAARFQLFQPLDFSHLHTTVFGLSVVKRGFTDAMLAGDLSDGLPTVLLLKNRYNGTGHPAVIG
jgi:hypothetical protein